jgi:site-specific recombinase XerC
MRLRADKWEFGEELLTAAAARGKRLTAPELGAILNANGYRTGTGKHYIGGRGVFSYAEHLLSASGSQVRQGSRWSDHDGIGHQAR